MKIESENIIKRVRIECSKFDSKKNPIYLLQYKTNRLTLFEKKKQIAISRKKFNAKNIHYDYDILMLIYIFFYQNQNSYGLIQRKKPTKKKPSINF